MKVARCTDSGAPFWALVDTGTGTVTPISGEFSEWAPRITRGEGQSALRFTGAVLALSSVLLLPPIERVNRVGVAGANYAKHLVEFGLKAPAQPFAFLKSYGALIGAQDQIRFPPLTDQLDHEVELVVVIGSDTIDHDDSLSSVLGYTVGNDVSARDLQHSGPPGIGMDLSAAKSQDATTGVDPWIVTRDEFPAGSPAGVGMGTGRFLNPGDVVEAAVEGIGVLTNIVSEKSPRR
ncbi:fumarylacetoacetate hydrolase family protein [Glaciimonas sp. CA11.2]|uniref:fumarylacetoacetate hydrolase family protein n=1 Tax=unclassified Glaciimonas TaxID=2644401 RepID=UPI002AB43005|nr:MULTISPECIES: fumarylacetoacetate hydrolase family protein [unclassified Glaciimonas]MDY7548984.1 fumarylacetoacetate hydrolase family protein [Glaciimonas sp. CA11.2]MEB0013683.1 fumarylacetoacetate hydrolase family protein [Glaciimonas sp. Cout2]MEB0081895.1 fumarylacetoacetate hydrolase family protein [Glaciimonas sp. Gout2]MEB0163577.1 fumarylacetoacetate hydrolase family protein [Glaciimonas sp. CA11.2]